MASKLEQDINAAIEAATRAGAGSPADDFLGKLAERIGATATVKAVFGDPIERDGLVVVPVAKVRWGFGGGAGSGPMPMMARTAADETGEAGTIGGGAAAGAGQGGGGGVTADPIGWLEIGPEGASFKPIVPAMPSPAFLLAATFGGSMVLRALARLLRRSG